MNTLVSVVSNVKYLFPFLLYLGIFKQLYLLTRLFCNNTIYLQRDVGTTTFVFSFSFHSENLQENDHCVDLNVGGY
jgi:hypothetical protein